MWFTWRAIGRGDGAAMRPLFRFLSRRVLVPLFRARMGWLVVNPVSGYCMVVRTTGRRTGRARHAAVMYALAGGDVECMAGWGPLTDWYRNTLADPRVTLYLPGRAVRGTAVEVTEPEERAAALRRILRASGLSALSAAGKPVIRIRPAGAPLTGGPFDPGGMGWLLVAGLAAVLAACAAVVLARRDG
jgi:deazaflavin-dependent oxidoreductase (nitroreductase family)